MLSRIFIRKYIGENLGWHAAGLWQGVFFISEVYLLVVTTSLRVYYLPTLSATKSKEQIIREILNGYKIIIPVVALIAFGIYILRDTIIWLLFSKDFTDMRDLFKWQLMGDVIKISSWLFSYLMVAKAKIKLMVVTEIIFSISWVLLTIFLVNLNGLVGATQAFAINYVLYLIVTFLIARRIISNAQS